MGSIRIETGKPVACDSPDHIQPHGTAQNNTQPRFNRKLERPIPAPEVRLLDLGCAGDGLVKYKLHCLTEILVIVTRAVVAGAESREVIAEYGRTKADFFRRFLTLENGIPSPDTFERVLAKLTRGRSPGRSADGWPAPAGRPAWSRSPTTASRPGRPGGTRPPGACTWSPPGPPRAAWSSARRRSRTAPTRWPRSPNCPECWTWQPVAQRAARFHSPMRNAG
jgi:hypothetical protein